MSDQWRITKTIDMDQPAERLFDYLSRWDSVVEWDPTAFSGRKLSPGEPAVGSRFVITLRFGWRPVPMTYTIVRMDRPRLLELEGRGAQFRALDRIRLTDTVTGCRLTYEVVIRFDRHPNSLASLVGRYLFDRYAQTTIRRLQRMVGGSATPPALSPVTRMADRAILPGLIGFSRLGYILGKHRRPVASALYAGRTIVLTGGTSGIGRAAARELVRRGGNLVVVGRDGEKLKGLLDELGGLKTGGWIETERADLSRLGEVQKLADRLMRRHDRIDALINNAGALFNDYGLTDEGIERTMATDLVSPYLLTVLLLPALKAAGSARVVNVASGGMYTQGMRAHMLESEPSDYDGPTAYARAKRGLVMLTEAWASRWVDFGIGVHAMHPGWVDTPGLKASLPAFHRQVAPLLRTPEQGADTIVWLAASPDAQRASGRFWLDRKIRATHVFRHTADTEEDRRDLIRALDALTGFPATA
jgi:dehydrogenase/reductase SDR family member 12